MEWPGRTLLQWCRPEVRGSQNFWLVLKGKEQLTFCRSIHLFSRRFRDSFFPEGMLAHLWRCGHHWHRLTNKSLFQGRYRGEGNYSPWVVLSSQTPAVSASEGKWKPLSLSEMLAISEEDSNPQWLRESARQLLQALSPTWKAEQSAFWCELWRAAHWHHNFDTPCTRIIQWGQARSKFQNLCKTAYLMMSTVIRDRQCRSQKMKFWPSSL